MVTGFYYSLTYGFSALMAGKISDVLARKPLLCTMAVLWNTTSFLNMIAHSFGMIAAMRMIFGLFSAFCSPICYSMIADYFPPAKRTLANACFTSASFLGIALSSMANNLVGSIGWRFTYFACGIYGYLATTIAAAFVKDPERGRYDPKK